MRSLLQFCEPAQAFTELVSDKSRSPLKHPKERFVINEQKVILAFVVHVHVFLDFIWILIQSMLTEIKCKN